MRDPEKSRAAARRYYAANREQVIERARKWHETHREQTRAASQRYYAAHRKERNEANRQYRLANAERLQDAEQRRRAADPEKYRTVAQNRRRANLEKARIAERQRYAKHREKRNAASRLYRLTHRETVRQAVRNWSRKNPEKTLAYSRKRRAVKSGAALRNFTAAQWREMQKIFHHRCAYCGKRAKGHLTQDHITPLAKGGNHTLHNIVPACSFCNSRKRTGPPLMQIQPLLL